MNRDPTKISGETWYVLKQHSRTFFVSLFEFAPLVFIVDNYMNIYMNILSYFFLHSPSFLALSNSLSASLLMYTTGKGGELNNRLAC